MGWKMKKGLLLAGIIIIVILDYILFKINDNFMVSDLVSIVEYVIIKLHGILAFILIMLYNYREHKKYRLNDKIYFISTIITGISLTFIFKILISSIYFFDALDFLFSNDITAFALEATNFYSIGEYIDKYASLFIGIAAAAYLMLFLKKEVAKEINEAQENNIDSYNYYSSNAVYYDESYLLLIL